MSAAWAAIETPIGELVLEGNGTSLAAVHLPNLRPDRLDPARRDHDLLAEPLRQLGEYFAGERRDFDLALAPAGTDFDRAVWREVHRIPYGRTASYLEVARAIGRPDRVRAVGGANARNPIPILVPCHRVIGSDGSLTGYAGGLERKRALLDLETGRLQAALW